MLASLHRFHGHTALGFVYKRGQTVRSPMLSLKYVINRQRSAFRAAVVVSRKVDKSAVVRNRIRRRVYAAVQRVSGQIEAPYDLVFTAFSNQLAICKPPEVDELVQMQLRKAGVIQPQTSHAIVKRKEL